MAERNKKEIADNFNSSQGFFGQPLDHEAPIIVCDCFAFIRNKGLYDVGVFRVSGSQDVVNALRKKYDAEYPDAESKESKQTSILNTHEPPPSVNDIASLLKSYFKDLKEPLIPIKSTEDMVKALKENEDDKMKIRALSKIVKAIPSPNRECLGFLISFLREICTFKKFNQMSAENLATCFVLSVMGGNDAFDQLYLLGNGAVVIKMLITKDIHLYMPRVQNVKKNTKYKDIGAANEADDHGHSAGEKTPPGQNRQASGSNANEAPFTPKGSSGKKTKVNRENPGAPIGGQYDDILKSGVEANSGSPAEPPARPKKNMNMTKKYDAPPDTIKYMPGVVPSNSNFKSNIANAPSNDTMIESLPPATGSPKAAANQTDKQRGKKVKDSNAKYDKSGNKQKNIMPSEAFPPFTQPASGSRNQRSKPVKADEPFPELVVPVISRPKAINDGDLPFPEGPDF